MKPFWNILTSTRLSGVYLLSFAIAIGVATFIENDFGTCAAQKFVFKAKWFELLLLLFGLSILSNMIRYKLLAQKKWGSLTFHLSILLILMGSAITRYFGEEGMMHIREGQLSNSYVSAESFVRMEVNLSEKKYQLNAPVLFSSLGSNSFQKELDAGGKKIQVRLKNYVPNPTSQLVEQRGGSKIIKIVFAGQSGREEFFIKEGEQPIIHGVQFNFSANEMADAFNVFTSGDSLNFRMNQPVNRRVMATQEASDLVANSVHLFVPRAMYAYGEHSFVLGDYQPSGIIQKKSAGDKITNESLEGLELEVAVDGKTQDVYIEGRKGELGQKSILNFNGTQVAISYGAKEVTLPFSIRCNDFILEKYPGTENPSSYASEVTLLDPANSVEMNYRIFMNNILNYDGFRFFQSSFDPDEMGTYLSVNHDSWGTWITYVGYIFLTLGLIFSLLDRKSRFRTLISKLNAGFVLLILISFTTLAQSGTSISREHATKFGSLLVQDYNGRVKPLNSYTAEIFRKLAKKESLFDLSSDQLFLSMMLNPSAWTKEKIIKIPDSPELKSLLGVQDDMINYDSFFTPDGSYKLEQQVRTSQMKNPKDQGTFDKALLKVDEKLNILNMVFNGNMIRIFPQESSNMGTWLSAYDLQKEETATQFHQVKDLLVNYLTAVQQGGDSGDFSEADAILNQMKAYQVLNGGEQLPSEFKIKAELLLNRLNIFNRLIGFFAIMSLLLTASFLYFTIKLNPTKSKKLVQISFWLIGIAFVLYSVGLGLRWYISGRAPWSNGYESMIYIGWTTLLGGLFFSRKSLGGLAATCTLGFIILLVASMSWLDPEITPLVPVLKSYWLTIHVSLEAGSYGFLLLGAVISMMNLLLMVFTTSKNIVVVKRSIRELTMISEITLLVGLTMVSIGTYLGGVWANESWGRYWGWDAKETWALVTILVYSFILHMRFIPKLQGVFAYNFATLFGFATVIMTYLGVNYYLSGLHSYAAGDPVPIPAEVYVTTIVLIALSAIAYVKYRKLLIGKHE